MGAALALVLVTAGLLLGSATAVQARVTPKRDYPRLPASCVEPGGTIPLEPGICKINDYRQWRPTLVVWGDSHAYQLIPALKSATAGRDINLVAFVLGGCPPMDPHLNTPEKRRNATSCEKSNDLALRYALNRKREGRETKLLLAGAWNRYLTALREGTPPSESYAARIARDLETDTPRLFRRLGMAKLSADVVGQSLQVPPDAVCPLGRDPFVCSLPRSQMLPSEADNKYWVKNAMQPLVGNARYLSTNGAVCSLRLCHGMVDDIYTFFDDLHISATRSRTLARSFRLTVNDVSQ